MQVTVCAGQAFGTVRAPASKSMAHRLLICAALARGESRIQGVSDCADVSATLDCLRALGAECQQNKDEVVIRGIDPRKATVTEPLYCRESGSTMRFMIPPAWLSGAPVTLGGAPYLLTRPMDVYASIAKEKGYVFEQDPNRIRVCGPLLAGDYTVKGNISSQFISGLLFALPLLEGDSRICILPPVESRSYLDLTVSALREFGVKVTWRDSNTLYIRGGQSYHAHDTQVEGDYSGAAFLEAFNVLGGNVQVTGLNEQSLQGDRVYRQYFAALEKGSAEVSIEDCPDLGPILFAVAAAKHGGKFTGTRRLRIKESDRAAVMAEELRKFGVSVTVCEDSVLVDPVAFHAPKETVDGHNDHRIVMATSVLLTLTGGTVRGAEAVQKSFPAFFDCLRALGIKIRETKGETKSSCI